MSRRLPQTAYLIESSSPGTTPVQCDQIRRLLKSSWAIFKMFLTTNIQAANFCDFWANLENVNFLIKTAVWLLYGLLYGLLFGKYGLLISTSVANLVKPLRA